MTKRTTREIVNESVTLITEGKGNNAKYFVRVLGYPFGPIEREEWAIEAKEHCRRELERLLEEAHG